MIIDKLKEILSVIYGEQSEKVAEKLVSELDEITEESAGTPDKKWYHNIELYCVYPDGVLYDSKKTPLQNLRQHLKKVQSLGMNGLHILPFLESPMQDRGFDISHYLKVNPQYGTIEDIKDIMADARELGIHVFMDLVFNHVSHQHEWFKKAIQGDEYYRDFFLHTQEQPKFIRKFFKDSAVWAEYEVEGKKEIVNIAFPEYAGPIPHWQKQEDGYWYYHTYYPSQIDLNWRNPELFIIMAKVVLYWAKLGFNFRLDAIPFVGKGPYKQVNTINKEAHALTAAFRCIADQVNCNCAFLVETYEELDAVIEYFGKENKISADLSYNFHLCTSIWMSLVTEKVEPIWNKLEKLEKIPSHAEWLNFLRNHDELSLAYLSDDTLKMMQKKLLDKGADFREGCGISGRTYSLLDENTNRFLMAYFLLASLPGGMMLPYGDETGKSNIPIDKIAKSEQHDTRNINRGVIRAKDYDLPETAKIFEAISGMIRQRRILRLYLNNWPLQIKAQENLFAVTYSNGSSRLFIYINLGHKKCEIRLEEKDLQIILQVNEASIEGNSLKLGPYGGAWLKHVT